MVRDSAATRARILDAAATEFAAHGISGARIDRIATAAKANKQLIYAHFGDKERLFETVLEQRLVALTEEVPFDADDLPGYVGRLFDYVVAHPELIRLAAWEGLERPARAGAAHATGPYGKKLKALAAAQRQGRLDATIPPADLLALLVALAFAWSIASPELHALCPGDPWCPKRLAEHRGAVVEATRRILAPADRDQVRESDKVRSSS